MGQVLADGRRLFVRQVFTQRIISVQPVGKPPRPAPLANLPQMCSSSARLAPVRQREPAESRLRARRAGAPRAHSRRDALVPSRFQHPPHLPHSLLLPERPRRRHPPPPTLKGTQELQTTAEHPLGTPKNKTFLDFRIS